MNNIVRILYCRVSFVIFCLAFFLAPRLSGQVLQDDNLRANYLIGFTDFVRWDRGLNTPTTIAVIGSQTLFAQLERVAEKKRSKGRNYRIIESQVGDSLEGIDILHIGSGYKAKWTELISKAKKLSIVTVGEEEGFLDAGGLIEFTVQRNRLRFSLNLEETTQYQVNLSSKLVQIAL